MSSFINYDQNMETSPNDRMNDDHASLGAIISASQVQASRSFQNGNLNATSTEYALQQHQLSQQPQHHVMMMIDSRICRDFLRGTCKRGSMCKYIHQLIATPTSTSLATGVNQHGHNNLLSPLVPNSNNLSINTSIVCRDYQNGVCSRATTCRYLHIPPQNSSIANTGSPKDDNAPLDYDKEEGLMMIMMATHSSTTPMVLTGSCFSQPQSPSPFEREASSPNNASQKAGHGMDVSHAIHSSLSPLAFTPNPSGTNLGHLSTKDSKIPICRDYMKGRCDRGFRCRFRHITMADYGVDAKEKLLQQHCTPFKASPIGGTIFDGVTARNRNYSTITGPTYPHIIENYDYLSATYPHHQYHQHHLHPSGLPVVVSAASVATATAIAGPLIISRQPPAAALQYSLPLSMQSCPLTYVPASATINILDPILEPPLTKRRLYQQPQHNSTSYITCDHVSNNFNDAPNTNPGNVTSTNSPYFTASEGSEFSTNNSNNQHQFNNGASTINRNAGTLSHSEKALVEENESLKQRLDTLKKQIAELNATVDMLLEQNRRLRLCGMGGGILAPHSPASAQPPQAPHNGSIHGLATNNPSMTLGYVQPMGNNPNQQQNILQQAPSSLSPPPSNYQPNLPSYPYGSPLPTVPNTSNLSSPLINPPQYHQHINHVDVSAAEPPSCSSRRNIPVVRGPSPIHATNLKVPKYNPVKNLSPPTNISSEQPTSPLRRPIDDSSSAQNEHE